MSVLENPMIVGAVVVIAVGYVIVRRFVGEPLHLRDLAVPPLILLLLGVREVIAGDALTAGQTTALVAVGAIAVIFGGLRAATVGLYLRDGELWYRYRPVTFLAWGITAVVGALVRLSVYAGTDLPDGSRSLYLSAGLTLAGESLVLAARGWCSGERFATAGRNSEVTKKTIHSEMKNKLRGRRSIR